MSGLFIDAHLDLAWNALAYDRNLCLDVAEMRRRESAMKDDRCRGGAMVSLPAMRAGRVAACCATLLARSGPEPRYPEAGFRRTDIDHTDAAMAYATAQGQLAFYRLLAERGEIRLIGTRGDWLEHLSRWEKGVETRIGVIPAMEGADPICSPDQLAAWVQDGLRVLSLAHYGKSRYAGGTATETGLTTDGRALLKNMEKLGVILDATHLSDPALDEALDSFGGGVLASHHNQRALVSGQRQLPDEHIRRLLARGAVIGVSFDCWMLKEGWKTGQTPREEVGLDCVADQIDRYCQLAGSAGQVGIGSDLDGGFGAERSPSGMESIASFEKLRAVLAGRGHDEKTIDGFCWENWQKFFAEHLPE